MGSNKSNRFKTEKECTEFLKTIGINNIICLKYGGTHKSTSRFKCLIDNYEWDTTLDALRNRFATGCPKCGNVARIKNIVEVNKWLQDNNKNIECLYYDGITSSSNSVFKCKIDGYEWNAKFSNIKSGKGCPVCSKVKKIKSIDEVNGWLKNNNIDLECIFYAGNVADKSTFKCNICDYIFESTFNNIKNGNGCPHCNLSKGEKTIKKILDSYNINYISQYKFNDCRDILPLPFDFVLFKNDIPKVAIEYQGIQHYLPIDFAGKGRDWAIKNMQKTQEHDDIKMNYCFGHNIYYYEIAYWDFIYDGFFKEWKPKFIEMLNTYFGE